MLRRRMMMAQGGVSLPAGYTKIEYLESDGNSYIDTGFKPNQDTRVVCDAQVLGSGETGIAMATDAQYYYTLYVNASVVGTRYGNQDPKTFASNAPAYNERLIYDKNKNVTTVGGYTITHNAATFQLAYSLYLFARNNAGTTDWAGKVRLYSCQIYDNGVLARDFIPAMNASGEAGLYDLKNDVWYALKPVVTKKENKISIKETGQEWEEVSHPITGEPFWIRSCVGEVTSTYPVATKITGKYMVEAMSTYTDIFVLFKESSAELVLYRRPEHSNGLGPIITSISPTEDDTYIYTF